MSYSSKKSEVLDHLKLYLECFADLVSNSIWINSCGQMYASFINHHEII